MSSNGVACERWLRALDRRFPTVIAGPKTARECLERVPGATHFVGRQHQIEPRGKGKALSTLRGRRPYLDVPAVGEGELLRARGGRRLLRKVQLMQHLAPATQVRAIAHQGVEHRSVSGVNIGITCQRINPLRPSEPVH